MCVQCLRSSNSGRLFNSNAGSRRENGWTHWKQGERIPKSFLSHTESQLLDYWHAVTQSRTIVPLCPHVPPSTTVSRNGTESQRDEITKGPTNSHNWVSQEMKNEQRALKLSSFSLFVEDTEVWAATSRDFCKNKDGLIEEICPVVHIYNSSG